MASGEMSEPEFIDFLTTATRHMKKWSGPDALHYVATDWRRRWQNWTGQGAVRVADGVTFASLEATALSGAIT